MADFRQRLVDECMSSYRSVQCGYPAIAAVASLIATTACEIFGFPVFILQADQPVNDRTRVNAQANLFDNSGVTSLPEAAYHGGIEISVRGNSSFAFHKKNYRIELQDFDGKDHKASLLGLPADSDWVLYASVTDRTFIRNVLGPELWRRMGRYAPRWRFVEVFMVTNQMDLKPTEAVASAAAQVLQTLSATNSSVANLTSTTSNSLVRSLANSYLGVYVLMEKIKRGKDRVKIKRLRPEHDKEPEISGGYIIKKDDLGRGQRGVLTGQEFRLRYEEPKESELTQNQRDWMRRYLDDLEKALFSPHFRDPELGYRKYLDVESFIDFHWLVEVGMNADGYWFSQYMHKDRDGKLTMGPVWDWDNAFGSTYFRLHLRSDEWRFETAKDPDYAWYRRLFEDPDFLQRYVDRWSELRTNVLATSNVLALVDGIAAQVREAELRNTHRWPNAGGVTVTPAQSREIFERELGILRDWLAKRLAWIDSQDFPKPSVRQRVTPGEPATLSVNWDVGRAFYTVDGSDPRARGGSVAPSALEYKAPILTPAKAVMTVRVRSEYGLWSAPVLFPTDTDRLR